MLKKADLMQNNNLDPLLNEYFRLRVKCIIAIAKKFGKRRSEIASLKMNDVRIEDGFVYVTFSLRKKHKKGMFQYLEFLRNEDPIALNKPYNVLETEWHDWTHTIEGYRLKKNRRTKRVSLQDKYARLICEYYKFMKQNFPDAHFLFPSGKMVFGENYKMQPQKHLTGKHLLFLIKQLDSTVWLHLFRELKGATIARKEGQTIDAVYKVKSALDLSKPETAYNYIERFAVQTMDEELEEDEETEVESEELEDEIVL